MKVRANTAVGGVLIGAAARHRRYRRILDALRSAAYQFARAPSGRRRRCTGSAPTNSAVTC